MSTLEHVKEQYSAHMEIRRTLNPARGFILALAALALSVATLVALTATDFPTLNNILDTCAMLLGAVLAFLLWDLGWRTGELLPKLKAICFAVFSVMELAHIFTALDVSMAPGWVRGLSAQLRLGTLAPAAYLLPLALLAALLLRRRDVRLPLFAAGLLLLGLALLLIQQKLPSYASPLASHVSRPTFLLLPLLWLPVIWIHTRIRGEDRLAHLFAMFAALMLLMPLFMIFSRTTADVAAMSGHAAKVIAELFLLFGLMQIGTADTARRIAATRELKLSNEALEARVAERTAELEALNANLRHEVEVRTSAEQRTHTQLERLELLRRITHAIAERQDLHSIFQVVVRSLEEHLPVDFAVMCDYEHHARRLTVSRVGTRSEKLATSLAMTENSRIEIDENGLSRCVAGKLVYEPDITEIPYPFPQRLAGAALRSMVIVPLMVEQRSGVFGVLVLARHMTASFSSGDCEFLRQLCDHVSLAANQAQLHESLKRAYDDLQLSQNAVMQQERLRALGQMASGIAHDINNAISPVSLYVEALLNHETGFSERARKQLEVIQRAVDDVAHTVSRMGEFHRQRPPQTQLLSMDVNSVLTDVLDLTRARWSDMAQRRGAVIETRVENLGETPVVMAIESEIREALINLVLNATDAMPDGGVLTLRTGHALEAGKGVARRVYIEVCDTGFGMDEATRRRCLEPFFTTKGDRGSGLGLAMVYGIAQRHGVDIDIRSAPGEGTVFRLTFPLTAPAPQSTASVRIQKIPTHTKILVIDDDPLLLTSLRETLVNEGHQVQTASGGRAGIDAFRDALKAGTPFPVVITDLGMPHVDGRVVAAAIKAAEPGTGIIMLTGWGQRLVASGDIPPGVNVVLSKPPKLGDLRQALADLAPD
jgi:signal transduction histidine kinase/ActR/RegA family two-component response regulator